MRRHLRSCIRCQRHIRITEAVCPFCEQPVPESRRRPPERGNPSRRLNRAMTLATVATVGAVGAAVELTACSSDDSAAPAPVADAAPDGNPAVLPDASDAAPDAIVAVAAYGSPGIADAEAGAPVTGGDAYGLAVMDATDDKSDADAAPDVIGAEAAYGGPPRDAVADVTDAAPDVTTGGDAYGVPPPEAGNDAETD